MSIWNAASFVTANAVLAQGASPMLRQDELVTLLPGLKVEPSKRSGWLVFQTNRTPELRIERNSFQLAMNYNGNDDQKWPFTAILAALVGKACGATTRDWPEALLRRLYASKSLEPERDLGGNGGTTFSKKISDRQGGCTVDVSAVGARWHDLIATVSRSATQGQATTSKPSGTATYNDLVLQGNRAAMAGKFEDAIDFWRKAIPLDPSPLIECRGESMRTNIRAAEDAISMVRQRKLSQADGPSYYARHQTELWMPNRCNRN